MDHCYRMRLPDGRWRYVAEPYGLDGRALEDLRVLAGLGYEVSISADGARHFPGRTVAVWLTTPPAGGSS